ncbi:MAG: glucosaminidase domain-containing protein, partial [Marinilabiliales bacterium]|nr:glucosaminidase domain-containing protein [Marinilabiliales bacterium]
MYDDAIYPQYQIRTDSIIISNIRSVLPQRTTALIPVRYHGIFDFDTIPEGIRKNLFIDYLLPAIVIERERLLDQMRHVEFIENRMINKRPLRTDDLLFFKELMVKYDANSLKDLKIRLFPHPVSLVLAQAALESGWGTSKVFSKAYNPFGIMSFSSDEQRHRFLNPNHQ